MTDTIIKCDRCGQERNSPRRTDEPAGCYRCREFERDRRQGLFWARIQPLPDATLWKESSPMARMGDLKITHFGRGYWVIKGTIPIDLARLIYADPVGRDLIRAGGHCGCMAPDTEKTWKTSEGKTVVAAAEEPRVDALLEKYPQPGFKERYAFSDDPKSIGASEVVELYHIDGDLGLRVFVDIVRAHSPEGMEVKL